MMIQSQSLGEDGKLPSQREQQAGERMRTSQAGRKALQKSTAEILE